MNCQEEKHFYLTSPIIQLFQFYIWYCNSRAKASIPKMGNIICVE